MEESERKQRSWVGITTATFLGIAATLGVGSYQVLRSGRQAELAELERSRAARAAIVSIVEEHVLNEKPLSIPRLQRLVAQRRRADRVADGIPVHEVIEQAEFNVFQTAYLSFERKEALKAVFDSLYAELAARDFKPFSSEDPNSELANEVASLIQSGDPQDALQALTRLHEAQSAELARASIEGRRGSRFKALSEFLQDPSAVNFVLVTAFLYVFAAAFLLRMRRTGSLRRVLALMLGVAGSASAGVRTAEAPDCPACGSPVPVSLGVATGETARAVCKDCSARFFVHRTREGVKTSEESTAGESTTGSCPACGKDVAFKVRSDRDVSFVHPCPHCRTHLRFEGNATDFNLDDLCEFNSSYECPHCGQDSEVWVSPQGTPRFLHECRSCGKLVQVTGPKEELTVEPAV